MLDYYPIIKHAHCSTHKYNVCMFVRVHCIDEGNKIIERTWRYGNLLILQIQIWGYTMEKKVLIQMIINNCKKKWKHLCMCVCICISFFVTKSVANID